MTTTIIRTYWRDNKNPYPGRLVSVRTERLTAAELAWREYCRRQREAAEAHEAEEMARLADEFEALVERANKTETEN